MMSTNYVLVVKVCYILCVNLVYPVTFSCYSKVLKYHLDYSIFTLQDIVSLDHGLR